MIQRILVPTDGSPLSERALPLAEVVASAQNSEVFLVQVVPPPVWATDGGGYGAYEPISPELYQQVIDALDESARANLDELSRRLQHYATPIRTQAELLHGSPLAALLDYERQVGPGLMILATHGRTGLARFARGSVADCMVREGVAPVLMARSFGREALSLQRALVPLDGSPLAEEALPMVETLAGKPLQRARLLRVVERPDEEFAARTYLDEVAARLLASGLDVEVDVRTGDPGASITETANSVDLVVMATHGRGGLNRLRHGSVAERTLRDTPAPLLLVRAGTRTSMPGANAGRETTPVG